MPERAMASNRSEKSAESIARAGRQVVQEVEVPLPLG
jgi:hypothetical protein